jgi:hypothetical protein
MKRWQKVVLGVAVVAGWIAYVDYRDGADSRENLAEARADQAARLADNDLWRREADCTGALMSRGREPATAVTNCLDPSHGQYAQALSTCLRDALGGSLAPPYTGASIEYEWTECAIAQQPYEEAVD